MLLGPPSLTILTTCALRRRLRPEGPGLLGFRRWIRWITRELENDGACTGSECYARILNAIIRSTITTKLMSRTTQKYCCISEGTQIGRDFVVPAPAHLEKPCEPENSNRFSSLQPCCIEYDLPGMLRQKKNHSQSGGGYGWFRSFGFGGSFIQEGQLSGGRATAQERLVDMLQRRLHDFTRCWSTSSLICWCVADQEDHTT